MAEDGTMSERHASWIELFFDLVAVAGVAQLTHLLHGAPALTDVGLYALLYLAFWTTWACFTMYGNVAGDRTRVPALLVAMFGLSVMAASVAGIRAEHARAFTVAYVLARLLSGSIWRRGQIVVDWPVAQMSVGVLPWIASLWVPAPARYWLWGAGLALDLLIMFGFSGSRVLAQAQERFDRAVTRGRRGGRRPDDGRVPTLEAARSDPGHLGERLGLFVIIVLGEAVVQIIAATAETPWDGALTAAAVGAFALLVGMWVLSVLRGFAGVPRLRGSALPVHLAMVLHCLTTGVIAALAAGLGTVLAHPHGHVPTGTRWLLCGSAAAYFALGALAGLTPRVDRGWLLGRALPCTAVPLALAVFGGHLAPGWVVWALVAAVYWQLATDHFGVKREEITNPAPGSLPIRDR